MTGKIVIRETVPADLAAIVEVHKMGFGYDKEAGLTAELLSDPTAEPTVSLLALRDGEAVGHILFTRCRRIAGSGSGAAGAPTSSHRSPSGPDPREARASQTVAQRRGAAAAAGAGRETRLRTRTQGVLPRATASFPERKNWDFRPLIRFWKNMRTTGWRRR